MYSKLASAYIVLLASFSCDAFSPAAPPSWGVTSLSRTSLSMTVEVADPPATTPPAEEDAEEKKQPRRVNVGVIGCGRIGLVHLEAITKAPGVKCVAVSNPTVSKAEAAAEKYGVPKFTSEAMDVITDPDVDAVWICSPSSFHADQIKAAAANGKHVFCEKPIATDLAETVEAINACNDADVKLMIGLQRRFCSNFVRVKEAIDKKEVGDPIMIKLCSRDPSAPPFEYVKGGGGIFTDMAVHDLDMSRFLAGADPIEILALGSCHIDKSIEALDGAEAYDTASCLVKYPNGVQAHIDVCRQSSYGYDQRAEVLGTKGMIATDNVYPNTAKIYKNDYTGNADMPFDFFLARYNEAYVDETVAFCQSLVFDTPVPCTGEDGLVALVMALAAGKSAEENRWVSFSEIIQSVYCSSPTECSLLSQSDVFPDTFKPANSASELLTADYDEKKESSKPEGNFFDRVKSMVGVQ